MDSKTVSEKGLKRVRFIGIALVIMSIIAVSVLTAFLITRVFLADSPSVTAREVTETGITPTEITPVDNFPSSYETAEGITPFGKLYYMEMKTGGRWIAIVGGDLPPGTEFPATIELAVPAGVTVRFFGMLCAQSTIEENAFPYPYKMRTVGDFDIYTATLYSGYDVQLEYFLRRDPIISSSEGYSVRLSYVPWHHARHLEMSVVVPIGSASLTRDTGLESTPGADFQSITYSFFNVRPGYQHTAEIFFTVPPR